MVHAHTLHASIAEELEDRKRIKKIKRIRRHITRVEMDKIPVAKNNLKPRLPRGVFRANLGNHIISYSVNNSFGQRKWTNDDKVCQFFKPPPPPQPAPCGHGTRKRAVTVIPAVPVTKSWRGRGEAERTRMTTSLSLSAMPCHAMPRTPYSVANRSADASSLVLQLVTSQPGPLLPSSLEARWTGHPGRWLRPLMPCTRRPPPRTVCVYYVPCIFFSFLVELVD